MQDEDRTDRLARIIEEMIQGGMPEHLDDEELQELLQIAKIRLDAARLAAQTGADAQGAVLERLVARLDMLEKGPDGQHNSPATANDYAADISADDEDPDDVDVKQLQDIIGLRRQMAEHAAAISESHRDAVWQRVQSRIQITQSENRGFLRWPFRRRDREAEELGVALDRMAMGEPVWETQNSELSELLQVARMRQAAAITASAGFVDQRTRIWARLRPRLMARLSRSRRPRIFIGRGAVPWRKLAAAGAGLALVIAAVGPIPATGLAHHPVVNLANYVRDAIGVTETSAPPAVPPVTEVIESRSVSVKEASVLVGAPVREPTFLPDGYRHASSQYFSRAITADEGGVYVLAYEGSSTVDSPDTMLIYQERTSSNTVAVERGFSQNVWLAAGVPATHISGTWRPTGSDLGWTDDDGQTILFDLGGVRTIIFASDGDLALSSLVDVADGLASQATPPTN